MKNKRQEKLLQIIKEKPIFTQDDLQNELNAYGFKVTQSTVSRDIRELKLVKGHDAQGNYRYITPDVRANEKNSDNYRDMIKNSVISVNYAVNDVVVKCFNGMAQSACVSLDIMFGDIMLGSVAGDDTVLIVAESESKAKDLCEQISNIL